GGRLAASTDSVGTKVKVAIAAGRHDGIGRDLVNHCLNDIATARARPLFFLDYFATGRLDEAVWSAVVKSVAAACADAGCALLGRPLGEELLEPHRSYLGELRHLEWKAAAHITGGGLPGNVARVLPEGLAARLDTSTWTPAPIFELLARRGRVDPDEMLATFNM